MIAEELQIVIDAKVAAAVRDMRKVDTQLGKTEKSAHMLAAAFKSIAGPLAIGAVIAGAIRIGKEFSKMGSAAEEVNSKYLTVFRGLGSDAVDTANALADSFDLAGSTAQELLGNTGDLLTGLGFTQREALDLSETVNTLAIDLASFSNYSGGAAGASEALTKALLGESEMAKGLGIVINQNTQEYKDAIKYYTEVEGKTLLQAKAYTALQFATEQSGNAIGDYERTSDSAANVSRRLKEANKELGEVLGDMLNNALTPIKGVLAEIVVSQTEWLELIRQQQKDVEIINRGIGTSVEKISAWQRAIDETKETLSGIAESERGPGRERIARYENLIALEKQRQRALAQQALFEEDAAKKQATIDTLAEEAAARLLTVKEDLGGKAEKQLKNLNSEIVYWAQFRDIVGVQALLNSLIAERINLQKEIASSNKGAGSEVDNNQAIMDSAMERVAVEEAAMFSREAIRMADLASEKAYNEARSKSIVDANNAAAESFGVALVSAKSFGEAVKEAAKSATVSVLRMLGVEASVRAAVALAKVFGGDLAAIPEAAQWASASAAAYAGAGAVSAFGNGGDFMTTGPQLIMVGEKGREHVRIDPQPGVSGGSGGGINIYIDGVVNEDLAVEIGEQIISARARGFAV